MLRASGLMNCIETTAECGRGGSIYCWQVFEPSRAPNFLPTKGYKKHCDKSQNQFKFPSHLSLLIRKPPPLPLLRMEIYFFLKIRWGGDGGGSTTHNRIMHDENFLSVSLSHPKLFSWLKLFSGNKVLLLPHTKKRALHGNFGKTQTAESHYL